MKIVAWGDIHGRKEWEAIVESHLDADVFVSMGDEWDSFDIPFDRQLENFKKLVDFKERNTEKVKLLIGNHLFHYTPTASMFGDHYSGYQKAHAVVIGHIIAAHRDLFQMAYRWENYLFTHAGLTNTWLRHTLEQAAADLPPVHETDIASFLNEVWKSKPSRFLFNGYDGYGDDVTQSPIWVRPSSLNQDAYDMIQVVGHTHQKAIGREPTKFSNGGSGLFIDCPGQYLVIQDNRIEVHRVKKDYLV